MSDNRDTSHGEAKAANGPARQPVPNEYRYVLKKGDIIACCSIVHPLGHGGMGEVYLAKHENLMDWRAIKIIPPSHVLRHSSSLEQFLSEGRLQTRLRHPNVIQVYDMAQDVRHNICYLVMEYVEGESVGDKLRKAMKSGKGASVFSEKEALSIVLKVAETMNDVSIDGKPIVHRDIKPDNIMLAASGDVKIADWGIATFVGSRAERIGTWAYMAPELTAPKPDATDCRGDIYALGITFYEMLAGEKPFTDSKEKRGKYATLFDTPDIRSIRREVSQGTALLIRRMMARSKTARPSSWEAVCKEMRKTLETLDSGGERHTWLAWPFIRLNGLATELCVAVRGCAPWKTILVGTAVVMLAGTVVFLVLLATRDEGVFHEMRISFKRKCISKEHLSYFPPGIEPPWDYLHLIRRHDRDNWINNDYREWQHKTEGH